MPEGAPTRTQLLDAFNTLEFPGWYETACESPQSGLELVGEGEYLIVTDLTFDVVQKDENLITGTATMTLNDGSMHTATVRIRESDIDGECVCDTPGNTGKALDVWLYHFIMGLLKNDDLEDGEFSITRWNDLPA